VNPLRSLVFGMLVLTGLIGSEHAVQAQSCKVCAEQQKACMKNYAGPACKTEYQMCRKSCRK